MPAPAFRINFVTGAARRYLPRVEAMAAVPEHLAAAIEGRGADWLRSAPAAGGPSPARTVGHMTAYARGTYEHLFRMAWMTDPVLNLVEEDGEAENAEWDALSAAQLLEQFTAAVAECVDLLKDLPDSSWGRPGQHPVFGRRSIRRQVDIAVDHLEDHITALRRTP